jgi:hypothetical protein
VCHHPNATPRVHPSVVRSSRQPIGIAEGLQGCGYGRGQQPWQHQAPNRDQVIKGDGPSPLPTGPTIQSRGRAKRVGVCVGRLIECASRPLSVGYYSEEKAEPSRSSPFFANDRSSGALVPPPPKPLPLSQNINPIRFDSTEINQHPTSKQDGARGYERCAARLAGRCRCGGAVRRRCRRWCCSRDQPVAARARARARAPSMRPRRAGK